MYKYIAGLVLTLVVPIAIAGKPAVFSNDAVAIRGYDPVAYFIAGEPTRGSSQFAADWRGVTWHFANAENLARFRADPTAFAPQYGGYCAYAVSQGYTAPTVPEAWSIVDGKLYLNYSKGVRQRWNQNIPGYIRAADTNWPGVLN